MISLALKNTALGLLQPCDKLKKEHDTNIPLCLKMIIQRSKSVNMPLVVTIT